MNKILNRLEEITTGYSVFEKDQVLTHEQLNSVADYFDDQTRLTRIKLLGVGIACGLRVSLDGSKVKVTKGAGVTTDGDLLYLGSGTLFDKFKVRDDSYPDYGPFHEGGGMIKVYELVAQGTTDQRATPLSSFSARTGSSLNDMVAMLFMEGYVKDEDLCSGTDCDNLGKDFVNTTKLLLIGKESVGLLQSTIPTPAQAASALSEIVADRAVLTSEITTLGQLAAVYRAAANSIHGKLVAEFPKLYANGSPFLGDVFATDPGGRWIAKLKAANALFKGSNSGIQYYYDFLKDVVETWNHLRELLFAAGATWCCPETEGFPKHLLLGSVVSGVDPRENRTEFYSSPIASRAVEQLSHFQFLARKLDALIETFQAPATGSPLRITPSGCEDSRLEERAIPYYYRVDPVKPIQNSWNYRLHQQGMDAWNYSYNALAFGAQGGAIDPFNAQVGRFTFFRIEGHLGQDVTAADIEAEIKAANLPIAVQSVFLGTEKSKVVKKPGIRFTDLHRLHQVFRTDLGDQLENAKTFSSHYAKQIGDTLTADDVEDVALSKTIATQKNETISGSARSAQVTLAQKYVAYKTNNNWTPAVSTAMTAAAQFKQNLGEVTKTQFTTPFDSLIGTSHVNWLNWLDIHIQDKEEKEDEKLLFSKFQAAHPGLEHFGGVVRGGTFVLVYDESKRVVADFMLPYYNSPPVTEEDPAEPALPVPVVDNAGTPVKGSSILLDGVQLKPSIEKYVAGKLNVFTRDVVVPQINIQKDQISLFKDSITTMAGVFGGVKAQTGVQTGGTKFSDSLLDAAVNETKTKQRTVEVLNEKAIDPGLSQEARDKYTQLTKEAEADLALSIQDTTRYIAESGADVSTGSEGLVAMTEMSKSLGAIRDTAALTSARTGLNEVKNSTADANLKIALTGMTRF